MSRPVTLWSRQYGSLIPGNPITPSTVFGFLLWDLPEFRKVEWKNPRAQSQATDQILPTEIGCQWLKIQIFQIKTSGSQSLFKNLKMFQFWGWMVTRKWWARSSCIRPGMDFTCPVAVSLGFVTQSCRRTSKSLGWSPSFYVTMVMGATSKEQANLDK